MTGLSIETRQAAGAEADLDVLDVEPAVFARAIGVDVETMNAALAGECGVELVAIRRRLFSAANAHQVARALARRSILKSNGDKL